MERSVDEHATDSSQPCRKGKITDSISALEASYEGYRIECRRRRTECTTKGVVMRKILVFACIMLLLVPAVVLVGCGGGDTEQAGEYVKQADQLATERGSKNTEILNAWKAVRQSTDSTAKAAAWEQAESIYSEMQELVKKEKAEYAKIKKLNGVEDYVKYAELKIQELTAYDQMLKATNDFQKKMYNNEFGSQQELEAANQAYQAEANKLQEENEQANKKAEQLKKDKNL